VEDVYILATTRLRKAAAGQTDDRELRTEDNRQPATGNWQLATGNWQLATGNR